MKLRTDPMSKVFPKIAKCTFHKYGPSGTIQNHDGLCVLPLNIINEKIYVFLWFWFVFLANLTAIQIIYRLAVLFTPRLRELLLRARSRLAPLYEIEAVCRKSRIGDWFLLYQLGKNIDPLIFREFIRDLHKKMESQKDMEAYT
jgi:hypothetical protein